MAAGDILGVAIGTDGWYADVTVEGVAVGGTYNFGLGALGNPETGTPKLSILVTSLGFDDTGAATTVTRTVVGTKQVRKAYPNHAQNEESTTGGNTTIRIALSDYIYAKDATGTGNSGTAPVATLLSGLYTQGGTSSATASVTVTNNSTFAYPKVVGNWSWPAFDKRPSTWTLSATAFHSSAQQGRPVRCVKFSASDGTNTITNVVTVPSIDPSRGDTVPVVEYVATMDASTATPAALTQGAVLTENFIAYPWIGDAASVLDTSAGTAQPTPFYGPAKSVCDKSGGYATSIAIVDSVSGNDGTGAVGTNIASPPAAYATIAAALTALKTYNNTNYSRNNPGGSVIYLKTGSHAWIGGTYTAGTTPDAWVTITRYPGLTVSDVNISSQSGGHAASARAKIVGVTFTAQAATGTIGSSTHAWLDNCIVNCPTSNQPPFYDVSIVYLTRTSFTALAQSLRPFATTAMAPAIIRGCTGAPGTAGALAYVFLGNDMTMAGTGDTGGTAPTSVNTIIAFNKLKWMTSPAGALIALKQATLTETHGLAVIQNLLEGTPSTSQPLLQIAADGSTGKPVNNVLMWHNTLVGQRANLGYNEVDTSQGGGGLAYRLGWSLKNNVFDDINIKTDTFAGSGFVAEGVKVGNWALLYGVGCSGQFDNETSGIGAPGTFGFEFPGVRSDQPTPTPGTQPITSGTRAATYPQFVDRKSFDGVSAGTGGGNYRPQATSPLAGLQRDMVLAYDLAGDPRIALDAVGAYAMSRSLLVALGFFA